MNRVVVWVVMTLLASRLVAADARVEILEPQAGRAVFSEVEIAAHIDAEEGVSRVTFRVDGLIVGQLEKPPWSVKADVGDENVPHLFEVELETVSGQIVLARRQTPPLHVDLEIDLSLRQIYATVTREGKRVLDLGMEDFEVRDGGQRQEIVTLSRGDVPLAAVLLIDASESMIGARMDAARSAADALVQGLRVLDQAKVMVVSDRILHETPFSDISEVLRTGLSGVRPRGSTAIHDHLYMALELLEDRQGRRAVILLSDGIDVTSVLNADAISETIRRSRAVVYWVRLGDPGRVGHRSSAWRDAAEHRRSYEKLEEAVLASGGRIHSLSSIEDTAHAVQEIFAELREQYAIGYYPSSRSGDGTWHRVEVKTRRRGLHVRSRRGYIDD